MEKPELINAVIEIAEVEYFISEEAAEAIENRSSDVVLKRVIDHKEESFLLTTIEASISKYGIIDYLS